MDSLETSSSAQQALPDQIFVVKHMDDDAIEGMEVSKTILQMSKTLKDLLADVGESTSEAIIIPPSPNDPSPIRTMDLVFECLELSKQGISIESEVKRTSLSGLIYALNLIDYLDIDDPQMNDTFQDALNQQLSQLSSEKLNQNKDLILSLNINVERRIHYKILSEAIACKRIAILKEKGIAPKNYHAMQQIDFSITDKIALNHDGTKIVFTRNQNQDIGLLDTTTGKIIQTFPWINIYSLNFKFTPSGKCLIIVENDYIKIWDIATGKLLQSLEHKQIRSMLLSPNGTFLASESPEKIILWQKNKSQDTYDELYTINEYNKVYDFNLDETQLIVSAFIMTNDKPPKITNNINIWDIKKRKPLSHRPLILSNNYPVLKFPPQGEDLFAGKNDKIAINNIDILERKVGGMDNLGVLYRYINISPDKRICIENLTFGRGEEPKIFLLDSIKNSTLCEIKAGEHGINTREAVSAIFSGDNNTIALWDDKVVSLGKKPLLVVKLLNETDQNELEKLRSLSLFDLLINIKSSCEKGQKI